MVMNSEAQDNGRFLGRPSHLKHRSDNPACTGWGSAGVNVMDISYDHWRDHMLLDLDACFFLCQV